MFTKDTQKLSYANTKSIKERQGQNIKNTK